MAAIQPITRPQLNDKLGNSLLIFTIEISGARVEPPIIFDEFGKLALEERHELAHGAGH